MDLTSILPSEDYSHGSVARLLKVGNFHPAAASQDDDDADEKGNTWLDIEEDSTEEIKTSFESLLRNAAKNGLSEDGSKFLRNRRYHHRYIFRLHLEPDPAADVAQMKIQLKPGYMSHIGKTRRYTPEQINFMSNYVLKLELYGFIKSNANESWVSAPLLGPKPPPAHYRLTFYLRMVNSATVPIVWPIPHIESELRDLAGSTCLACIDFCSG